MATKPKIYQAPSKDQNVYLYCMIHCPSCGSIGWIDADQFEGKVSIWCTEDGCDYHETHDLRKEAGN